MHRVISSLFDSYRSSDERDERLNEKVVEINHVDLRLMIYKEIENTKEGVVSSLSSRFLSRFTNDCVLYPDTHLLRI